MFEGPETDRLQLRELVDRYSDAVARIDAQAWRETWTEDAQWHFHGESICGRARIVETWTHAMASFQTLMFLAQPGSMIISGDTADMVTHTFEYLAPVEGPPRLQAGIYRDKAIRGGTEWRFAERYFSSRELRL
jgi:ketosteroid isomerase-like protein